MPNIPNPAGAIPPVQQQQQQQDFLGMDSKKWMGVGLAGIVTLIKYFLTKDSFDGKGLGLALAALSTGGDVMRGRAAGEEKRRKASEEQQKLDKEQKIWDFKIGQEEYKKSRDVRADSIADAAATRQAGLDKRAAWKHEQEVLKAQRDQEEWESYKQALAILREKPDDSDAIWTLMNSKYTEKKMQDQLYEMMEGEGEGTTPAQTATIAGGIESRPPITTEEPWVTDAETGETIMTDRQLTPEMSLDMGYDPYKDSAAVYDRMKGLSELEADTLTGVVPLGAIKAAGVKARGELAKVAAKRKEGDIWDRLLSDATPSLRDTTVIVPPTEGEIIKAFTALNQPVSISLLRAEYGDELDYQKIINALESKGLVAE